MSYERTKRGPLCFWGLIGIFLLFFTGLDRPCILFKLFHEAIVGENFQAPGAHEWQSLLEVQLHLSDQVSDHEGGRTGHSGIAKLGIRQKSITSGLR